MLQIDNTIISLDILEEFFICDIPYCKGACCIEGDFGAPLEEEEIKTFELIYDKLEPYLTFAGIKSIRKFGKYTLDNENSFVTPLIDNKECAYSYFEGDICKCAIEKAYLDNIINFKKPVSCHLYPIRISEYSHFTAVNYSKWHICSPACKKGKKEKILMFEFLKEPLIRRFGKEWYEELSIAAKELKNK